MSHQVQPLTNTATPTPPSIKLPEEFNKGLTITLIALAIIVILGSLAIALTGFSIAGIKLTGLLHQMNQLTSWLIIAGGVVVGALILHRGIYRARTTAFREELLRRAEECNRLTNPLIEAEKMMEANQRDDKFFGGVAFILSEKAKLDLSAPKLFLNSPAYRAFSKRVDLLQKYAGMHADGWYHQNENLENYEILKWIKADKDQLKFAGYSHEIVPKAEEIPIGAVLLYNPAAVAKSNELRGLPRSRLQQFKSMLCKTATGLPLTHAMVSLGGGRFIHIDKVNEATGESTGCCSGQATLEDHSIRARAERAEKEAQKALSAGKAPPKARCPYRCMYNFEIMVPNYEKMAQALGYKGTDPRKYVEQHLNAEWAPKLEGTLGVTKTPFLTIAGAIFGGARPENYDPTTVFKPDREGGFSCSGFIGSSYGAVGIDLGKQFGKRVDKLSPADYVSSEFFDIGYSNDRQLLLSVRPGTQENTLNEENVVPVDGTETPREAHPEADGA